MSHSRSMCNVLDALCLILC